MEEASAVCTSFFIGFSYPSILTVVLLVRLGALVDSSALLFPLRFLFR